MLFTCKIYVDNSNAEFMTNFVTKIGNSNWQKKSWPNSSWEKDFSNIYCIYSYEKIIYPLWPTLPQRVMIFTTFNLHYLRVFPDVLQLSCWLVSHQNIFKEFLKMKQLKLACSFELIGHDLLNKMKKQKLNDIS